jgi:hypothetical protein
MESPSRLRCISAPLLGWPDGTHGESADAAQRT